MKRLSCLALALLACTGLAAEPDSELAFDPDTFDPATPVCEDPYLHANARWLETAAIPPGYPAWGTRLAVVERNRQQQRAIAERAAARLAAGQAQGDEALVRDWWSGDDRHKFEALGRRVVQRYGAQRSESGLAVDGTLTLTENIADLGGLAIAYDALQRRLAASPVAPIDSLDQDRRFFLRYATIWRTRSSPQFEQLRLKTDTHAPERLRALVPLSDQPQFAAAFGCKAGDAMWRAEADRVGLW